MKSDQAMSVTLIQYVMKTPFEIKQMITVVYLIIINTFIQFRRKNRVIE